MAVTAVALLGSAVSPWAPSAAAAAPSCGDQEAGKGIDEQWRCTFADEFNGAGLDPAKWVAQRTDTSGYTSGPTACFVDSPSNIAVSGGTLDLTVRKEPAPFTCEDPHGSFPTQYTSGMVSTWDRFSQAYGRFEVRARISSARVAGLQTSLWLWPADQSRYGTWPTSGEIDIAEMFSVYPDRAIPYIHYTPLVPDLSVTNTSCIIERPDGFHTYALVWSPRIIKVIYDGRTCLIERDWSPAPPLSAPQPFDQPFIIALTQALGMGTNAFDPSTTPLPATTSVDYVRAWRRRAGRCRTRAKRARERCLQRRGARRASSSG
jgi:beta-glucanase (GH16 family)